MADIINFNSDQHSPKAVLDRLGEHIDEIDSLIVLWMDKESRQRGESTKMSMMEMTLLYCFLQSWIQLWFVAPDEEM